MMKLSVQNIKNSNQLKNVSDAVSNQNTGGFVDGNTDPLLDDYEYDANDFRVKDFEKVFCEETERSSMVKDRNKGISNISYNYLNLPTQIEFEGTNNKITYLYNAVGQKLNKTVVYSDSIKIVDYLDGFQYAGGILQFFPHAEGYVKATPQSSTPNGNITYYLYNYVFNYTDHLGNVRVSYTKDPQNGTLQILDENHYYPFGLKHEVYVGSNKRDFGLLSIGGGIGEIALKEVLKTEYQYKYNGKEWQDELGLNWYSYGFRMYDPALGRFPSMDPISSQFPHVSPYNYAENEPVSSIDLWGLQRWIVNGRERNNPMPKWRTKARTAGFAIRHPKAANKIGTGGRGSTDITGVAGRYARHFAESTGTSKGIGSKSNALRHAIWSSAIRSEFDAGISKRATNAHEGVGIAENQSVDFSKTFNGKGNDGLELADHIVDVLNNEIGFSLAESNPDATIGELATIALTEFKENGLWTASADKDGNITITRTKLSEKEYEKALNHFNTLNENGFTKEEQKQIDKEKDK